MNFIRLENGQLKVDQVGTGDIKIIDATLEDLIAEGFMDSETMPSNKIIQVMDGISDQLGLTWKGAITWDPLDRNLGGAVFMSIPWRAVE